LRFFGWCTNIEGYDIKELSLELLTRKAFYQDYIDWLRQERNCGVSVGTKIFNISISIAKYKTFRESKTVNWSDIPLVKFLRSERKRFVDLLKEEQPEIREEKWKKKEISHPQAIEVVDYLYQFCAFKRLKFPKTDKQALIKKHLSALVRNWQIYLMIKILVYAPVRQEEIRKLRIGSTLKLVEDSQGIVRYAVKIKEHKNSRSTGKPRYYPLPKFLTKDISTWINEIRPLAINAPETIDSWLAFWGYSTKEITNLENLIQKAEAEETLNEKYCESRRIRLKAMKNRIEAWETAKHNAENCDHLFFGLGRSHPKSFCFSFEKSHHSNISYQISQGVGNATLALFGEAKFLNPHGFRNVGAKHLRAIGRAGDKEAFSAFLGHSVEIDDDYADTLTNDYDLIERVVDNWWNEP
jgi:integrase